MRALATLIVLAAAAAPAQAAADRWTVVDHGDQVEVIVRGVTATATTATQVRERLEVAIAPQALDLETFPRDATIREIDVRGRAPRVVSIKLRLDRDAVKALAPLATVAQRGDELHVTFPRALGVTAAPATTTPPAGPAAPIGPIGPTPPPIALAPVAIVPPVTAATAPAPTAIIPARPTPTTTPELDGPAPIVAPRIDPGFELPIVPLFSVLGAGALAGAAWLRRKRKGAATAHDLDIVATRSLGGKARIVWLAAGERELVVSVTNQQVRLLSQWRRSRATGAPEARALERRAQGSSPSIPTATTGALAAAPALAPSPAFTASFAAALAAERDRPANPDDDDEVGDDAIVPPAPRARTSSPAVSGILKLRERAAHLDEDIASGDPAEDEQWARDVLSAMRGRR